MAAEFTYQIRKFDDTCSDLSAIYDLNQETLYFDPEKGEERTFTYMNKILSKKPTTWILVALDPSNSLLGYAAFYTNQAAGKVFKKLQQDEVYLASIVVKEEYRRRGIAQAFYPWFFQAYPRFEHIIEDIDYPDIVTKDGKKLIPAKLRDNGFLVIKISGDLLRSRWKISRKPSEEIVDKSSEDFGPSNEEILEHTVSSRKF